MNDSLHGEEQTIFELRPAYRAQLGLLVWGVLLVPVVGIGLILLLRAWYRVAATRYRLTSQRLFAQTGLIAKELAAGFFAIFQAAGSSATQAAGRLRARCGGKRRA